MILPRLRKYHASLRFTVPPLPLPLLHNPNPNLRHKVSTSHYTLSLSLSLRCFWFHCYLFQIWFLFSLISKRGSQVFSLLGNFIGWGKGNTEIFSFPVQEMKMFLDQSLSTVFFFFFFQKIFLKLCFFHLASSQVVIVANNFYIVYYQNLYF